MILTPRLITHSARALSQITAPVLNLHPTGGVISDDQQKLLLQDKIHNIRFIGLPTPFHKIHNILPALRARQVTGTAVRGRGGRQGLQ